jgi:hypothetical protein
VWHYESGSAPPQDPTAANLPSGPYIIDGLVNGKDYTEYVTAKSEYDSRDSVKKTVALLPPPDSPDNPTLTPGVGQIGASWDAVDNATSYEVWYHTTNDFSQALKYADVPGTSVVITGLAPDTAYHVWLRAKNRGSPSAPGASSVATTPASGAITAGVGLDGGITVTDGSENDVSAGFALAVSESVTLSADAGFSDVNWHVDGASAGSVITLDGALYNDQGDHSVTFTGTKDGILHSSNPIPFRVTP